MSDSFHKSMVKGLREALEIARGEAIPQMVTTKHHGIVLKIQVKGKTVFKLSDKLQEVPEILDDKIHSEAEFLKAYRDVVQQSQEAMAQLYGLNVNTYRNWEQGRRKPNKAVLRLMEMAVYEAEAFFRQPQEKRRLEFA